MASLSSLNGIKMATIQLLPTTHSHFALVHHFAFSRWILPQASRQSLNSNFWPWWGRWISLNWTDCWSTREIQIGPKGIIPGVINLPWTTLSVKKLDMFTISDIFETTFGAIPLDGMWDYSNSKTLILYCNGAWCSQSPTDVIDATIIAKVSNIRLRKCICFPILIHKRSMLIDWRTQRRHWWDTSKTLLSARPP